MCIRDRFLASCRKAAAQIRDFHQREVQQSWFMARPDGTILGQKVTPLDSVGIYVPGGRAQYPSTVLMNAIPAKVAGVGRIVMVTPPQAGGGLSPYTLCAAAIAGVDEIYTVGGAQAIAALAYGTCLLYTSRRARPSPPTPPRGPSRPAGRGSAACA